MTVRIVAGYAALFGLAYVALSLWVVRERGRRGVGLGSGGLPGLERRVRVHANFAEYVPFTLLLAGLAELEGLPDVLLHATCLALLAGRALHGWAVAQPTEPPGRVPGMVLTLSALAGAALAAGWGSLVAR